jgi:anaerobic selenocysteine-containing dehydrogenase
MQRRDFLKISAVTGATAALDACGSPDHQLIRFIPEEDLVPGIATWKPSICTLCPAGCGMLVRIMQGEAEVVRNGQLGLIKMGLAKKLEGNPNHPISQGKLCPRGQAGLQVTYHPDRIKNPLARTGPRGSGQFKEITWDEAIKQLVAQLSALSSQQVKNGGSGFRFLTSPLRGERANIVATFTQAFKSPDYIEFSFFDDQVIQAANLESFGYFAPPTVDLGQSNYVISFGADFLGTWNSPVAQSLAYGQMRNGRPGLRGKFVHVEPRMSLTAANADEWVPCSPGTEGLIALSLANVILREKLRSANAADRAGGLIPGWSAGLLDYAPEKIEKQAGIPAATITRLAREAAAQGPAVAMIGDAAVAHTNGHFNALAVNALNALLGSVGKPGGILFTPPAVIRPNFASLRNAGLSQGDEPFLTPFKIAVDLTLRNIETPKILVVNQCNPVYATPPSWRVREAFEKIPFIASFGSFIDETSVLADLILPDHSPLESWLDDDPPSGSALAVASLAPPAMSPLHNTRAMPDVLLDVLHQLGDVTKTVPWKNYEEALKISFAGLQKEKGSVSAADPDEFWKKVQAQGGWWSANVKQLPPEAPLKPAPAVKNSAAEFDGPPDQFPFHFLPFASQMFYDGSLAHLPWMQEAPDPLSSVMWGSWIEINTQTASKMGIKQGDLLEVASQHGTLRAPAMVVPGIAPDVIAMPIGQGHENFTRYASGRGANPISILAPMTVGDTGSLAWAATRVKISRVGDGKMVLFGGSLTEQSPELKHR